MSSALLDRRQILAALIGTAPLLLAQRSLAADGAAHGRNHVVTMKGMKFAPQKLKVEIGDTITWINSDLAPHSAMALDGSWDTGRIVRGKSATITVSDGMSGSYRCKYHPQMKADFTVG